MSLSINLEIGHEASLRTKNTPEGFTHDWKIFVRGCDGANIHYYIEKVVFNLHDTFQKPRRVIKEPPYAVKESGYAGFIIPIEIYLRNSGEPKKIKFSYDLSLQRTGPPVRKLKKEKYFFTSPPEDFREKLLKGGAVVTNNSQEINENKSILHEEKNQLISKPKLSGDLPSKKPKLDPPISNSFQDLFGTPITKTSRAPEPKSTLPSSKENKVSTKPEKDKGSDKMKSKYSPQKDKDREREKIEKKDKKGEKKKDKERRDKDRERSREKVLKMEKSPKMRTPSPKHHSPKSGSPVPQSSQIASAEKYREKEIKNESDKKEKRDEEEKRSKRDKKEKDSGRDKEKHRDNKCDLKSKEMKTKELSHSQESDASSLLPVMSDTFSVKQEKKESHKDEEKPRADKIDKSEEKKHKHKKKDKNKKDRRDKEEKSSKTPKKSEKEKNTANSQAQSVLNASGTSVDAEMSETTNLFGNSPKIEPQSPPPSPKETEKPSAKIFSAVSDGPTDSSASSREASPVRGDIERGRRNNENDSEKKRKRASDSSDLEEPPTKMNKEEENLLSGDENISDVEDQSDENIEEAGGPYAEEDLEECDEFEEMDEETYNTLHDLKERIMLIDNNDELQKVVNVISDTGLYEVSSRTFDFDLRQLDTDTINQLLEILPVRQQDDTS